MISLAKRLEEVYVPGRSAPLDLAADSEASKLLQRVRDEAHRFAIDHHRGRRDRAMTGSVLDELQGIGPARKRALLQHFGSPERFLAATREELEAVPGVPGKVAPRDPRAAEQDRLGREGLVDRRRRDRAAGRHEPSKPCPTEPRHSSGVW